MSQIEEANAESVPLEAVSLMSKLNSTGRNRSVRIAALAFLILLNLIVRSYHVNEWLLPNVDEIVLMNTMNLPLLEGASTSSAYWPAHLIIKSCFFLHGFHQYRYISVVFGTAFILVMFATARRLVGFWPAWLMAAGLTFQWYFLYISRIVEIASFIPLFVALCLYVFVLWLESRRPGYLYALAGVAGIAMNIWSPPMVYLTFAVFAFLSWEALRRRLAWKTLLVASGVLLLALLPFFYVLENVAHVRQDIMVRYAMTANQAKVLVPANIAQPVPALKTWTQLVTCYHESGAWKVLAPLAILCLATPLVAWRQLRRVPAFIPLVTVAAILVVLIVACPVPLYIEGHAVPVFLILILLLLLAVVHGAGLGRVMATGSLAFILLASVFFVPHYFDNQEQRLFDWFDVHILKGGRPPICVSDGADLKLRKMPRIAAMNLQYPVFTCAPEERFWQDHSPADFRYVIATYEFDIEKNVVSKGYEPRLMLDMNNLLEANLKHGMFIWEVRRDEGISPPRLRD